MNDDPIVEEVRRVREELAAKFDFNVDAIFADLRKRELQHGDRLVFPKMRSCKTVEKSDENRPVAVTN